MLISIGILAWNEEDTITATLTSLFQQSALQGKGDIDTEWEIIVVPNGCSDNTATIAQQVLTQLAGQHVDSKITFAIRELREAGKSNAWNHYIHEFSSKNADLIIMIDADIEFGEVETISNTIQALDQHPQAMVAVDLPLKDVVKKPRKTFVEWISATASRVSNVGPTGIAGSFFCARAYALRQIWMPKGLAVEDGFLRAMIVTDCFRTSINEARIVRAKNASHYYETVTSLKGIFQHELRIVLGTAINCYFTWDFMMFATDPSGPGAGILIRNWMEKDPSWYSRFIDNTIKNHGFWVLPRGMLLRRFSTFKFHKGKGWIKWVSFAVLGFLMDLPILLAANRRLKKGGAIGYW